MYNKIFTKILDSSIWLEPTPTRIVWITLIAAMDETGYAHFSALQNLASRARVTMDEVEKAVDILSTPDENSSDPENEGRRIERVPGGFVILNAEKHRGIVTRTIQKEKTRLRVAKHRAKKKGNASVTDSNDSVTPSEAVTEAEANTNKTPLSGKPDRKQAKDILNFLNEKTGRRYEPVDANLKLITARLKEYGPDKLRQMIALKSRKWINDDNMSQYLRPATLFNATKCAQYIGELNG